MSVLTQLTTVGDVSKAKFEEQLTKMDPDTYHVLVIEQEEPKKIVGCGTIFFERKLVHQCSFAGHIEDICVSEEVRSKGVGKQLIKLLLEAGKEKGCYKVILDCSDKNIPFYEKCGLYKSGNEMRWDCK